MLFEWTSQPLSLQTIASQYALPVVIQAALGYRGSSKPVVLHSLLHLTFGFGRALKKSQSGTDHVYRALESEIVGVPIKYPGYFKCVPNAHDDIVSETSLQPIIERMHVDLRPQTFYIGASMRVFILETNVDGASVRVWNTIEPYQLIVFEQIVDIEYTPTADDNLTEEDYAYNWWYCFSKQILARNESVIKCITQQYQTCFIPCSSTDELNLLSIGQNGSSNSNKLQSIENLIGHFQLPVNIKLAQLPGSYAYKDFTGRMQLLGSRNDDFAVCASLSSNNIALIPKNTPLKFVVAPLPLTSTEMRQLLARCNMFTQSFNLQIRRILISSDDTPVRRHRSRYPKIQAAVNEQIKRCRRSQSVDVQTSIKVDEATTDEGYRSGSSAARKRTDYKRQRAVSVESEELPPPMPRKRTNSTDESTYDSLAHPSLTKARSRKLSLNSSVLEPPPVPKKPTNFPYPESWTYESGTNIMEKLDLPDADGAILLDSNNEILLVLPSSSRFS